MCARLSPDCLLCCWGFRLRLFHREVERFSVFSEAEEFPQSHTCRLLLCSRERLTRTLSQQLLITDTYTHTHTRYNSKNTLLFISVTSAQFLPFVCVCLCVGWGGAGHTSKGRRSTVGEQCWPPRSGGGVARGVTPLCPSAPAPTSPWGSQPSTYQTGPSLSDASRGSPAHTS